MNQLWDAVKGAAHDINQLLDDSDDDVPGDATLTVEKSQYSSSQDLLSSSERYSPGLGTYGSRITSNSKPNRLEATSLKKVTLPDRQPRLQFHAPLGGRGEDAPEYCDSSTQKAESANESPAPPNGDPVSLSATTRPSTSQRPSRDAESDEDSKSAFNEDSKSAFKRVHDSFVASESMWGKLFASPEYAKSLQRVIPSYLLERLQPFLQPQEKECDSQLLPDRAAELFKVTALCVVALSESHIQNEKLDYERQLEVTRSNLEELRAEIGALRARREEEVAETETALQKAREREVDQLSEGLQAQKQVEALNNRCETLVRRCEVLEEEGRTLRESRSDPPLSENENEQMGAMDPSAQVRTLICQNRILKEQVQSWQRTVDTAAEARNNMSAEIADLRTQLQHYTKVEDDLKHTRVLLQQARNIEDSRKAAEQNDIVAHNTELAAEVAETQEALQKLNAAFHDLQVNHDEQVTALTRRLSAYQDETDKTSNELQQSLKKVEELEGAAVKSESLEAKLAESEEMRTELEKNNQTLSNALSSVLKKLHQRDEDGEHWVAKKALFSQIEDRKIQLMEEKAGAARIRQESMTIISQWLGLSEDDAKFLGWTPSESLASSVSNDGQSLSALFLEYLEAEADGGGRG